MHADIWLTFYRDVFVCPQDPVLMLDIEGAVWRGGVRAHTPIAYLDSVTVTIYAIQLVTAAKILQVSIAQGKVIYHIDVM